VLRAKGVPATTIHRILYTPVYDPEFEKVAAWLTGEGARPAAGQLTDQQLDRAKVAYEQHGSVPAALAAAGLRGSDFITGWKRREEPLDLGWWTRHRCSTSVSSPTSRRSFRHFSCSAILPSFPRSRDRAPPAAWSSRSSRPSA
jgi:hypothetical protein